MSQVLRAEDVARVLARRAERLRALPVTSEEAVVWLAQFPLADEVYAVPLESLRGAIPLRLVRPVPLSVPHVIGTLMFQGELIAALSLASLVGVRGWRSDPATLVVVEVGSGHVCAIDCEAVPRPITLAKTTFEAAAARAAAVGIAEVSLDARTLIQLVDLPKLVAIAGGGHGH